MEVAGYRALIVDDEAYIRDLTSRALSQRSLACDTAADGDQGLLMATRYAYDVIITDLRMPNCNGHAMATEILDWPNRPRLVVLTGLQVPELVDDLRRRGVDEVLQKPVGFEELAETVLSLIDPALLDSCGGEGRHDTRMTMKIEKSLAELSDMFADRLDGVFDVDEVGIDPPTAVNDYIERLAEEEDLAAEKRDGAGSKPSDANRRRERVRVKATALAVPVDRHFLRNGEPFTLAVRDISESGVRLLSTRASKCEYLALRWACQTLPFRDIEVVGRVVRCEPLSRFYEYGCQFVLAD